MCSPNNPSGNSLKTDKVEALLNGFDGLVIIDEAYADFSPETSWLNRLEEFPNLIVTQTLSKAYGLAGIRLGMCFASEYIIEALNRIKPPYNVNQLTQDAALQILKRQDEIANQVSDILAQREWLTEELEWSPIVSRIWPSDANFILVEVDDADQRYNDLIRLGLVVRNRSSLPGCSNCLRITVGTGEENRKLVNAINQLT